MLKFKSLQQICHEIFYSQKLSKIPQISLRYHLEKVVYSITEGYSIQVYMNVCAPLS